MRNKSALDLRCLSVKASNQFETLPVPLCPSSYTLESRNFKWRIQLSKITRNAHVCIFFWYPAVIIFSKIQTPLAGWKPSAKHLAVGLGQTQCHVMKHDLSSDVRHEIMLVAVGGHKSGGNGVTLLVVYQKMLILQFSPSFSRQQVIDFLQSQV